MYGAFFLFLCLLLQTSLPTKSDKQPIVENRKASDKTKQSAQSSPVVASAASVSAPMSQPSSSGQHEDHKDDTANRIYRVKVESQPFDWRDGLYLAYILATAGAAIVAWRGLRALRQQSEILSDSQRSWFLVKQVQEPAMNGIWLETLTYIFQIIGNSPVRVIESKFVFRLVEGRQSKRNPKIIEPALPDAPVYGEPDTLLDIPTMGDIFPPGDGPHVPIRLETGILKKEEIEELKTWKKFAVCYGVVRYRDAFARSKIRETRVCYVYDVPQGLIPPDQAGKTNSGTFRVGGPPEYNEAT